MTNAEHNKYLAWAFIGHGSFQSIISVFMLAMFGLIFSIPDQPGQNPPGEFLLVLFGLVFMFQMFFVVPSFVAVYALLKRRSWARVASIVAGVIASMNVPFGTLACVYSLWFFLGENWKEIYVENHPKNVASLVDSAAEREVRWTGYHTTEQGEIIFHKVDPPDWR